MTKTENSIEEKLDILIKLAAIDAVRGREFREQVRVLDQAGIKPIEIARLLNKGSNNVRATISFIRKKRTGVKNE